MDSHLVSVEVGVECVTYKWMKLQCLAVHQYRLEGLESETVESRSSVEHDRMFLDNFVQDAPYLWCSLLDHSLCLLDVWSLVSFMKLSDKERLEELQGHK